MAPTCATPIDIERHKIDCLSFVMCLLLVQLILASFLLQLFTVLMKQTRQAVCAVKQSIFLDVYGHMIEAKFKNEIPL